MLAPVLALLQLSVHPLASGPADQDYPVIATDRVGRAWATWIEFSGPGDILQLAPMEGGYLGTGFHVNEGTGDLHRPALAIDAQGTIWCVWSEQRSGNWDLYVRSFARGVPGPIQRLTTDPFPDTNPVMAVSPTGRIWLAWQGAQNGGRFSRIFLRALINGRWARRSVAVTPDGFNSWEPALAVDSRGTVLLAWDSYQHGNYDVFFSRYANERLSPTRALTTDPRLHIRPQIALDAQDRTWIAFEEGSADWGKDAAQMTKGLHSERRVRLLVVDGDRLLEPPDPTAGLPPMTEFPHATFDGAGRLWLFVRTNTNQQIWRVVGRSFDGQAWSQPVAVNPSEGRQAVRMVSARDSEGGLHLLYATDLRKGPFQAVHNDIYYAQVAGGGTPAGTAALNPVSWPAPPPPRPWGKTWPSHTLLRHRLFWGELHRHTDINHHGRPDGALDDAYRYARDAAMMDFFATTDHLGDEPLNMGLTQTTWWRAQKYSDLFRVPGAFQPLYAYERSMNAPGGHKNVLFLRRDGPLIARRDLPPYLWTRLRQAAVPALTIPHQLTGPAIDWQFHDPEFQPVMEIYQGRRQNYEYDGAPQPPGVEQVWGKQSGSWAWDALARGHKIGFIASSDHFSTHMSYAAVYASELTPSGIFEALRARRTYAASDNIVLDFRAVDGGTEHLLGEAFTTTENPTLRVRAIGTDVVATAEIVRNGRFVYTQKPNAREFNFEYRDGEPLTGQEAYYYVRVRQQNGHLAWSSPIWITVRR
jgi:hypothetical protein